jgi:hypothetical protein
MVFHDREVNRNERQRQLNMKLSVLPKFIPANDYKIYHINRITSPILLPDLIQLARETIKFTIDTEHDYYTHQAALIQIEFIQAKSVVLLIETCHLPHASSLLFWLIQSLFKVILQPSNTIYSWGDAIFELSHFIQYGLFSSKTLQQINTINIQKRFKKWYNKIFVHDCGLLPLDNDNPLCTCLHRPVKNKNDQWSLQKAIAYTFNQFLDKKRRKSSWSRSLDIAYLQQHSVLNNNQKKILEHLILYAVNDCLAVTKLLVPLKLN